MLLTFRHYCRSLFAAYMKTYAIRFRFRAMRAHTFTSAVAARRFAAAHAYAGTRRSAVRRARV